MQVICHFKFNVYCIVICPTKITFSAVTSSWEKKNPKKTPEAFQTHNPCWQQLHVNFQPSLKLAGTHQCQEFLHPGIIFRSTEVMTTLWAAPAYPLSSALLVGGAAPILHRGRSVIQYEGPSMIAVQGSEGQPTHGRTHAYTHTRILLVFPTIVRSCWTPFVVSAPRTQNLNRLLH